MNYNARLQRFILTKYYSLGSLKICDENGLILFECYTLELPFISNQKNISSIPTNDYECKLIISPKFGIVFQVLNVVNRGNILIHKGNYTTDTHGCILVGSGFKMNNDKTNCTLKESKKAFTKLMSLGMKSFNLKITNVCL